MLDRFGAKVGLQDIDFKQNQTFSKMFVLQSDNEATVRAFFDEELLAEFAMREGITVDCFPKLLMYQKGGRKKPEEFRAFMADGFDLFKLLSARAASS